jgi:hypothetical protein
LIDVTVLLVDDADVVNRHAGVDITAVAIVDVTAHDHLRPDAFDCREELAAAEVFDSASDHIYETIAEPVWRLMRDHDVGAGRYGRVHLG